MITELDKAWLAGVLDAYSGRNVTAYASSAQRTVIPRLVIGNSRAPDALLDRVATLSGVSVRETKPTALTFRRGCSEHCPEKHIHVHEKASYRDITISGMRLLIILHNLKEYRVCGADALRKTEEFTARFTSSRRNVILNMRSMGWSLTPSMAMQLVCSTCGTEMVRQKTRIGCPNYCKRQAS